MRTNAAFTPLRLGAALAVLMIALAGCERRPSEPPAPNDPGRSMPTPSTDAMPSTSQAPLPMPPASAASR